MSRVDGTDPDTDRATTEWWIGFNRDGVDVLDITGQVHGILGALHQAQTITAGTDAPDDDGDPNDPSLTEVARVASALGVDMVALVRLHEENNPGRYH